jgi:Ca-activated chloride channel family protein
LFGRYGDGGSTTIELSGLAEGEPISYALDVTLPSEEREHGVLSKVWARNKIADLSSQMFYGDTPEVVEEITQMALDYRLMTQYTSFVAVDQSEVPQIGEELIPPRRVVIPVPLPEGVSFEGVFGPLGEEKSMAQDRLDHFGLRHSTGDVVN